jgi:hypothetical protein
MALHRGKWSTSQPRPFNPEERTPLSIEYDAGWAPEPIQTLHKEEKSVAPTEIQTLDHPAHSLGIILTTPSQSLDEINIYN